VEQDFVIPGKEGVSIQTLAQVAAEVLSNGALEATQEFEAEKMEQFNSSLAGHIINNFELNKTARRDSGIEEEMLESLRAFNGSYSPSDLAKIGSDGGSLIYMNITSTKCRACASWIKDILMPSNGRAWEVNASVVEDISPEFMEEIEKRLEEEFTNFEKAEKEAESKETSGAAGQGAPPPASNEAAPEAVAQTPQSSQGAQAPQESQQPKPPTPASKVAMRLREMNKARRDVKETIREEIRMVAKSEMKDMEKMIEDQLDAGDWEEALSDFVDNFCVYPTAFLKGPIITKRKKCSWNQGQLVEKDDYVFFNKAVNPLDMYPSPSANRIGDGALIEHMRLERKDLVSMKGLGADNGYKDFEIDEILEEYAAPEFVNWWNTDIEDEKATEEARGSSFHSNRNIIHALHFHGPASIKSVRDWGYPESELVNKKDTDEVEIEAILVGNTVIKVLLNDDPMKRRPYYKASFQNRPGSFWGRSLPNLMRSEQRMCNATARALANNMGAAAGPQAEIYIDRLADAGDITEITPFKIWQVTSDPTGAGGRAVTFSTVPSIAAELLSVYKEFELRADDATGIPRYAYGNERSIADYEKVWTSTGLVNICDLIIGDQVCNTYGGLSSVLGVYPQGECSIFRVKFSNGESVDCTMDHLWSVATNELFSTKSLEELLEEGIFRKDGEKWRPKFKLRPISAVQYADREVPVDPYTFGVWVGDGSKGTSCISGIDLEVFDNIPYPVSHAPDGIHHYCTGLITDLKKTSVWNEGSKTKFIPEEYLINSFEKRMELLRGLMDTDGCCAENGRLIFTTSSEKLRDTFIQLVRSVGGTSKGFSVNTKENYDPSYKITFQFNDLSIPLFKISRKEKRRAIRQTNGTLYIAGVEYVGNHTATCIKVDSEDHLYITEKFIPTHNTGGAAQTASGLSMLLESASKGIKDAIRHIDHGVIIPRVELQFYWNLKKYPELNYTGDIEVVGKGSAALTIKAAEQGKRMEFLQAIAGNPAIMGVVGEEGMAEIFRTMLQDINIGEILIPSRLELRTKSKEREQAAAQQQQQAIQLASEKNQIGLKATETQIQGQVNMHMEAMKRKDRELDLKEKTELARSIDKGRELETRERVASGRNTVDSARARAEQEQADLMQRREMAFDLETAQSESPTDTITKRMERNG